MPNFDGKKVLAREIERICELLNANKEFSEKVTFEKGSIDDFILKNLIKDQTEGHFKHYTFYSCHMPQANILIKADKSSEFDENKVSKVIHFVFENFEDYIKVPKSIEILEDMYNKRELFDFAGDIVATELCLKSNATGQQRIRFLLPNYYLKKFIEEEIATTAMRAPFLQEKVKDGIEGFQRVLSTDLSKMEKTYYTTSFLRKWDDYYFTVEDEKYVWVLKTMMKILIGDDIPKADKENIQATIEDVFQLISIPEITSKEIAPVFEFLFGYLNHSDSGQKDIFFKILKDVSKEETIPVINSTQLADKFSKLNEESKKFLGDFFIENHNLSKDYDPGNMFFSLSSEYAGLPENFKNHLNRGLLENEDINNLKLTHGQEKLLKGFTEEFYTLLPEAITNKLKEIKLKIEENKTSDSSALSDFEKLLG